MATAFFVAAIGRSLGGLGHAGVDAFRAALLLPSLGDPVSTFRDERSQASSHFAMGLAVKSALASIPELTGVAAAAALCRSRWDGGGAPALQGDAIPKGSQLLTAGILAAAALEVGRMASGLPDPSLAADLIRSCRGRELSPELADATASALREPDLRDRLANLSKEVAAAAARCPRLGSAESQILGALVGVQEAARPFGSGHGRRCARLARRIAERLGLPPDRQRLCELSALAHDLGEVGALVNPRAGAVGSFARLHPIRGAELLARLPGTRSLSDQVRSHHERLDGGGYPEGLRGDAISLESRVVAAAEVIDGMRSERPNREGLSREAIEAEIGRELCGSLDSEVVDAASREMELPT